MANTYYNMSLTGEQINNILNGIRSVTGIIKRNGENLYGSAIPGTDFIPGIVFGTTAPSAHPEIVVGGLYFRTTVNKLYLKISTTSWFEIIGTVIT